MGTHEVPACAKKHFSTSELRPITSTALQKYCEVYKGRLGTHWIYENDALVMDYIMRLTTHAM